MKRLTVLIIGLVLLVASFVLAIETTPYNITNSTIGTNSSINITNSTPVACNVPNCDGRIRLDEKDSNGCYIYSCPTTPLPRACKAPDCDGRQDSGKMDANGCPIYICQTQAVKMSEEVKCVFMNSEKEEECYAALPNQEGEGIKCKGTGSCTTKIHHNTGQITWKSTCGGYAYTTQDGNDEKAVFNCKTGETTPIETRNKGYMGASWECNDGKTDRARLDECMPYNYWWNKANFESCGAKLYEPGFPASQDSKTDYNGGVKSFSFIGECYLKESGEVIVNSSSGGGSSGWNSLDKCPDYKEACIGGKESACEIWKEECNIEEKITICKDSCSLDSKCYPFGYRKSGNYCSDSGSFTKQLVAGESCDNSFECGSNLCVSQKCVSQGLIERIIEWFKSIFGND